MKYSIIDSNKGEEYGLLPHLHRTLSNGSKMVVNENELKLVNSDINRAAETLGGVIMSQGEVINEINKTRTRNE